MYQKLMMLLGIIVALICVILGLLSVITWDAVAVLAPVSIGIPSLILAVYGKTTSKKHVEPKDETIEQKKEIIEEKVILRDETVRINRDAGHYFNVVNLERGDNLKGKISSDSPISIYFVDEANFKKWNKGRKRFDYEYCAENILETKIEYEVSKKGGWYLVIDNKGRKSALVKIYLYSSIS